jgi:Raf kinase inhibitor-like YbhB/YbcL family protein
MNDGMFFMQKTLKLFMKLFSADFKWGEQIPTEYTCLGPNINPSLQFENIPAGTASLVLIFEDVDATPKPWTHWMLFNIPPDTTEIKKSSIPGGATEGLANNNSFGYEGPCHKFFKGTHHYWFRLYALKEKLNLPAHSNRETVEKEMEGKIIAESNLCGLCTAESIEEIKQ